MVYQNFSLRGERFSQQTDVFLEKKFSSQSKRKILAAKKKILKGKKILNAKEKLSRQKKLSQQKKNSQGKRKFLTTIKRLLE